MNKNFFVAFLILFILHTSCKTEKSVTLPPITKTTKLVLDENSLGDFKISKETLLSEEKLQKAFPNYKVTKKIGQQDGPNFNLYELGSDAMLMTQKTSTNNLFKIWCDHNSKIVDEYGVAVETSFEELIKKRPNLKHTTEQFKTYLYQENSNICYQIQLLNYNSPDKKEYSIEEIKDSKVIAIIWK